MKFLFLIVAVFFSLPIHAGDEKVYDRESVRQIVKKSITKFKDCYDDGVKKNPSLEGKVVVEWVIAADGYVSAASIKLSTLNDDVVQKCVVDKIMVMKFPSPPVGTTASVSYPFFFSKAKK